MSSSFASFVAVEVVFATEGVEKCKSKLAASCEAGSEVEEEFEAGAGFEEELVPFGAEFGEVKLSCR